MAKRTIRRKRRPRAWVWIILILIILMATNSKSDEDPTQSSESHITEQRQVPENNEKSNPRLTSTVAPSKTSTPTITPKSYLLSEKSITPDNDNETEIGLSDADNSNPSTRSFADQSEHNVPKLPLT